MGLDMYLHARLYVSGYDFKTDEEKGQYSAVLEAAGVDADYGKSCGSPSAEVSMTVAYWRKANMIHKWFVDHVQGGVDDCGSYYVSREQIEELIARCKEVLGSVETVEGEVHTGTTYFSGGFAVNHSRPGRIIAQKGIAASKMPSAGGFFFGNTDYDERYLQGLEDTVKMLEPLLTDERLKEWSFEYHSSW